MKFIWLSPHLSWLFLYRLFRKVNHIAQILPLYFVQYTYFSKKNALIFPIFPFFPQERGTPKMLRILIRSRSNSLWTPEKSGKICKRKPSQPRYITWLRGFRNLSDYVILCVLNYAYWYNIRLKSPYYVVLHNGNSKGVCTAQLPIVLSLAVEKCYRLFLGQSRISHRKWIHPISPYMAISFYHENNIA